MDTQTLIKLLNYTGRLNTIPAFVLDEGELIYSSFSHLEEDAKAVLRNLSGNASEIFDVAGREMFACIPHKVGRKTLRIILGPGYTINPVGTAFKGKLILEKLVGKARVRDTLISLSEISADDFFEYADTLSLVLNNACLKRSFKAIETLSDKIDGELTEFVFGMRENELSPYSPEAEKKLIELLQSGDVKRLSEININYLSDAPGLKVEYLFKIVALITIATRAAVAKGVSAERAYGLSDLYLAKLGRAETDRQIADIAKNVLPHFGRLIAQFKTRDEEFSPHLAAAEKYIEQHLHFPLSLGDVASNIGVSEKYLSRLFAVKKKEKFTHFVSRLRVEEAKTLLARTDKKLVDIAYSLAFASESYFIKVFSDITGMTPREYRDRHRLAR